jgi:hypothetical protein
MRKPLRTKKYDGLMAEPSKEIQYLDRNRRMDNFRVLHKNSARTWPAKTANAARPRMASKWTEKQFCFTIKVDIDYIASPASFVRQRCGGASKALMKPNGVS